MTSGSENLSVPVLGAPTRAWQYGDPDGAPLILVHGFRGDHHGLEGIAQGIVSALPGVRAIVPDLPGFGASPAVPGREHDIELYGEWLREFSDAVAPAGFAVLGHSFGSIVVSAAIGGGLDPSRVILVNPISAPALEGPQALLTQLAVLYYRTADALPERAARRLLGNPIIVRAMSEVMAKTRDAELRAWIHGQHASYFSSFSDSSTLLQAFRASVSHTVSEYADSIDAPTLLIAGERDDLTPLPRQLELRHRIPGARLRILPGTGHLVHYETVADAVWFVAEFLTETAAASREAAA